MIGDALRTVLVANRGEVAMRIMRACRQMDIRTVAVFSEADAGAAYLRLADQAVCIGPAPTRSSYGNPAAVLLAAEATGADAIHPGYGFLAEDAAFARMVEDAGLVFIGPSSGVIAIMGDKVAAKRAMLESGVPCVPGSDGVLPDDPAALRLMAAGIGYPLLVKAAAGGGGRGMRVVHHAADLPGAVALTRAEAQQFFGRRDVYAERYLATPRHVEIQVLCDRHGHAVWLGERDCSIQRRHQKLLEESPAPGIDRALVAHIGERCVEACRRIGYVGAGTFEFLFEAGAFHFIEMNTRLQVEHPVTEAVTGIDVVQAQIRIAAGEVLPWRQADIVPTGHAMECRLNAEDPVSFAPSPGRITRWDMPGGPHVRVDSHIVAGETVTSHYDSLLAKLVVHAPSRAEAIRTMQAALAEVRVEGIRTNCDLHRAILADPAFQAGGVPIHHLETWLAQCRDDTMGEAMTVELDECETVRLSHDQVAQLAELLRPDGARTIQLETANGRFAVSLTHGAATPASIAGSTAPQGEVVRATSVGEFLTGYPSRGEVMVQPGARVMPGDVLGLVRTGLVFAPVRLPGADPRPAILVRVLVPPGTLVGYGTPLFEMERD